MNHFTRGPADAGLLKYHGRPTALTNEEVGREPPDWQADRRRGRRDGAANHIDAVRVDIDERPNVRFSPTRGSPQCTRIVLSRAPGRRRRPWPARRRVALAAAASPTTPPARPTRTATTRSSASPTSASSAATRTTARRATPATPASARPSPATAAARRECPANQECIANRCRACADDKECPGGITASTACCTLEEALQDRERLRPERGLRERLLHHREGAGAAAHAVHAGAGASSTSTSRR